MIETLRDWLIATLNVGAGTQDRLIASLLIVLALWVISWLVGRFLERSFADDARSLYYWRKFSQYVLAFIGLILIGGLWISNFRTFTTYFGLLSAGIAIALQDLLVNLAGWLFIIWRRPFAVGDRIEILGQAGDVIDTRLFEFSMLEIGNRIEAEQSTGRIIHIPNSKVFREPFANYSQGLPYIWNEVAALITFESSWEKAKQILMDIADEHTPPVTDTVKQNVLNARRRFLIYYGQLTPTVYTEVVGSGVRLTIRYLVQPRRRRNSEQRLWEAILHAFSEEPDIEFAYETVRFYQRSTEGNMARPPAVDENVSREP